MRIRKLVYGHYIELDLVKVKDYPTYSLYNVYKIENNKRSLLYKQCYTELQIKEIIDKGFCIDEVTNEK